MTQQTLGSRLHSSRTNRRRFVGGSALAAASLGASRVTLVGAQDVPEIVWSSWGNPGEVERFNQYTEEYNARHPEMTASFVASPTEYASRLITQLNGGTAPDVFYVGDDMVGTLKSSGAIIDITEQMSSADSPAQTDQFAEGLWGASMSPDGTVWGPPVDCNPGVIWYNQTLLEEVGATTMPADLQAEGAWTWDAFLTMCQQLQDAGKRGYVFGDGWGDRYGWAAANGGVPYADGQFVFNQDPACVEAIQFLYDNQQAELFTYTGTLPQGQGADAMLLSGQLGFAMFGRWVLPLLRDNESFTYDVVPFPTNTGNAIEPGPIYTAYISINAATEYPEESFVFLSEFVSVEGQRYRLEGNGNAVPSITGEADEVVTADGQPVHNQYFLDAREIGFALYYDEMNVPGLVTNINESLATFFLEGGDLQATLDTIADETNAALDESAG